MSKVDFSHDDGSLSAPVIEASKPTIQHWQDNNAGVQQTLVKLKASGVKTITWYSARGACDECAKNDKVTMRVNERFPSGAYIPPSHNHCQCDFITDAGKRYAWMGVDGEYKQLKDKL